jgi:uncharacterized repeat protein (TIGR01451 family)
MFKKITFIVLALALPLLGTLASQAGRAPAPYVSAQDEVRGLEIAKYRPHGEIVATYTFWYYIDLTNNTGVMLEDIVVTDTLPEGIAPYSVLPSAGGLFDPVSRTVTWEVTLEAGEQVQLWIRANTYSWAGGMTLVNTVTAEVAGMPAVSAQDVANVRRAPTPTPTPTNTPTPTPTNTPTPTMTATPTPVATLLVAKFVDQVEAMPGDTLQYTIVVMNDILGGDDPGTSVQLVDPLPETLELVDGSLSPGATYDEGTRTILWDGQVPQGGSIDVEFQAVLTEAAWDWRSVSNTVFVTDAFGRESEASAHTQILHPTATPTPPFGPHAGLIVHLPIVMANSR